MQPAQSVAPVPAAQSGASATSAQALAEAAAASQATSAPLDNQPDLRLVIEEDKAAGSYIYMTIDSATGKVISQIPREDVLRMREDAGYTPGSVVSSRS